MIPPQLQVSAIAFKKWRHKARKYKVVVKSVQNYGGTHGTFTTVTVERKGFPRPTTWPALVFLREFKPVGRTPLRTSRYERLGGGIWDDDQSPNGSSDNCV